MNLLVSVLIPIYNVSDYIEKCARSLFEQSLQDSIEFIFVNDATPDDSIAKLENIIEGYPSRKHQIKIIHHKENKGLASTRKTALKASIGTYITFVDSDDYVEVDMIEQLYKKAIKENADIVVTDVYMDQIKKQSIKYENLKKIENNLFGGIIENKYISGYLCSKLIKRDLCLNPECCVPDGLNLFEDRHVMTRLFYFTNKIVKLDKAFYHYVQYNPNAITKNKSQMHFDNVILFWKLLEDFLYKHQLYDEYKEVVGFAKVNDKIDLMLSIHTSTTLRKQYSTMFYEEETIYLKYFHRGRKLMLLLVRHQLFGIANLFHLYNILKHKHQLK